MEPLIGRQADLERVVAGLGRGRFVTITGPGGTGKTSLAREALAQHRDGAFVDLASIDDPSRIAAAIAAQLGLAETAEDDPVPLVGSWAQGTDRLLVLDNVEQIVGPVPAMTALLEAASSLRILATSRVPLRVPGEVTLELAPLELPADDSAEEVEASPAGALFLARARAIGSLPTLDDDAATAVAALCRRLDGLPLALELAAGRTRILSTAAILQRLEAHDDRLLAREHGEARHRSLSAVIDWSLDLLTPDEWAILGAVVPCVGGFDLAMIEALAGREVDGYAGLDGLMSYGLVSRQPQASDEPRFRLLETVREGAVARLGTDVDSTWRRLGAYLVAVVGAETARIDTREAPQALSRLDRERENIDAAIRALLPLEPTSALALAGAATPYWSARGRLRDGVAHLRAALAAAPADARGRARAHAGLSDLIFRLEGDAPSLADGRLAARLGRDEPDPDAEVKGLTVIAHAAIDQPPFDLGALASAKARASELLAQPDAPPLRRLGARQVILLAVVGEHGYMSDEVMEPLAASIAEARAAGAHLTLAKLLSNRALNHLARRSAREAIADAEEAAGLAADLGDTFLVGRSQESRAMGLAMSGRGGEAVAAMAPAIELAVESGSPFAIMDALGAAATIAALAGDALAAARYLGAGERAINEPMTSPTTEAIWDAARRDIGEVKWAFALREGRDSDPAATLLSFLDSGAGGPAVSAGSTSRSRLIPLRHGELTRREVEILKHLAAGRSDTEIAEALFISRKTASVHVSNIKGKLGVETRVEAALAARELGLGEI